MALAVSLYSSLAFYSNSPLVPRPGVSGLQDGLEGEHASQTGDMEDKFECCEMEGKTKKSLLLPERALTATFRMPVTLRSSTIVALLRTRQFLSRHFIFVDGFRR